MDSKAFLSFLLSKLGGAWREAEVVHQDNPTKSEVIAEIRKSETADYFLLFFAGHGKAVKGELPWSEMRLDLGSGETISERELNPGSARCVFILDCSHGFLESDDEKPLVTSAYFSNQEEDEDYRSVYEDELLSAESGVVKALVESDCLAHGSHSFTQHLLKEINIWTGTNKGALPLANAVSLAGKSMKQENPKVRQPEYRGGRRLRDFPIAVRL